MSRLLVRHYKILVASGILVLQQNVSFAAGFALIEHSASGVGNAFAGSAAVAEDASTIYFNPAGLSHLKGNQVVAAGHFIGPKISYDDQNSKTFNGSDTLNGSSSSEGATNAQVPNLYMSSTFKNGVSFGLGINVPFGLTTEYDDDWVGRYHGVKSEMLTVNINPSFALKFNKNLSMGVGLNIQKIDVTLTSAVDFGGICIAQFPAASCASFGLAPQQNDGFATISGDSWSTGLNFGLLANITKQTRVGLSYRAGVSHTISGSADFAVPFEAQILTSSGLFTDTDAKARLKLPAVASLSMMHSFSSKTQLLADVTWTEWSSFQELRIEYPDSPQPSSVTTSAWKDAYRLSLALNQKLMSKVKLRLGTAYDYSPLPGANHRTPRIPGSDRIWLSTGLGIDVIKSVHLDIGYAHLFAGKENSNNTLESEQVPTINHTLVGEFQSSVDIVSAQVVWIF